MSQFSVTKKVGNSVRAGKIICAIALIILALVIAFGMLPQHTKYYLARKNVFATPTDEYKKEQFYRGKTYSLYDWFAENSEGKFYLAPVQDGDGEDAYLIVYIPNKYEEKAARIIEQTRDYLESGDDSILKESINCNGYIDEINPKTMVYLNQYFDAAGAPASVRNQVADKMFVMYPLQKALLSESSLYMLLVLVCLVSAVGFLLSMFSKKHIKKMDSRLARESMTSKDLDEEFRTPLKQFGNIYMSDKHVMAVAMSPQILTIRDVVWMYPNKVNSVNSKPVYQAVFLTRNHECIRFPVKDETQAEALCRAVHEKQPRALYGYVIENSQMYYSNFNGLVDLVYNQGDEAPAVDGETPVQATAEEVLSPVLGPETPAQDSPAAENKEDQL